ncbi:non-structural maintenance of chromosomes element 3 homolog [Centruroides vittatus]|uniref:non-structural maintenance of chromosomes element 3 homolog n=1 Tax=Centruroides vittatus TaxID=120091 RepID=UPI00350F4F48
MSKSQNRGPKRKTSKPDSDEEYTVKSSQSSQSVIGIKEDELQHLVNDTVYYLLIADQKKQVIKKADIVKHVLKEQSRNFNTVITKAQDKLKQVYGIRLVELEGRKGHYILINYLKDCAVQRTNSDSENAKDGLLLIILTLIFMNGNVISEVHLWQTLKRFGLNPEPSSNKLHPIFGDVKKLVTAEFVRQLYLEYSRIQGSDPARYEFRWGPRASLEVSKRDILELVCKIFNNDMKVEQWTSQYQDMLHSEEMQK